MQHIKMDIQMFSGGSYDYGYEQLDRYIGNVFDNELSAMIADLQKVLHDLEWWDSGDYSEEYYRKSLEQFKSKWFLNKDTSDKIKLDYVRKSLLECLKEVGD